MELLIVQSVFDEAFWGFRSHWFVFFVEPFVFLRKNTNRRRCMQSGCVFSSLDTSQPKSVVSDLCDSVRWEKKCVWVFSIVVISCWCGLCTSIFFRVCWKTVKNNDEYPNLSIDTEDHLGLWETISRGWFLADMDLDNESRHDWTWFQPCISSSNFGEDEVSHKMNTMNRTSSSLEWSHVTLLFWAHLWDVRSW